MFGSNSTALNISAELLGLSKVEVVKVTPDLSSYEIIIIVKSTEKEIPCRVCGKPTSPNGLARTIRLRHLPLFDQNTYIEITPRRGKCNNCDDKRTTTEKMDWYSQFNFE